MGNPPPPTSATRPRSAWYTGLRAARWIGLRLGLVLAGICLALVVGELVARVCRPEYRRMFARYSGQEQDERKLYCEFDPMLGWRNLPNITGTFSRYEFKHSIRHNSLGLRGPEIGALPAPGKRRWLVLGDSFTWGYGVEENDTFCGQLMQALPDLEVVNLGVSGYGIDQEYLVLQEFADQLGAEGVLLCFFAGNDLEDSTSAVRWGKTKPLFNVDERGVLDLVSRPIAEPWAVDTRAAPDQGRTVSWFDPLAQHSTLFNVVVHDLASNRGVERWLREQQILPEWAAWETSGLILRSPDADILRRWNLCKALLRASRDRARDGGLQFVLVDLPGKMQMNPRLDTERYAPAQPGEWLAQFCAAENIEFIDAYPVLRAMETAAPGSAFYVQDQHLRPAGHRAVANEIAQFMRAHHGF